MIYSFIFYGLYLDLWSIFSEFLYMSEALFEVCISSCFSTISWKHCSFFHVLDFAPLSKVNWPYLCGSNSFFILNFHLSLISGYITGLTLDLWLTFLRKLSDLSGSLAWFIICSYSPWWLFVHYLFSNFLFVLSFPYFHLMKLSPISLNKWKQSEDSSTVPSHNILLSKHFLFLISTIPFFLAASLTAF